MQGAQNRRWAMVEGGEGGINEAKLAAPIVAPALLSAGHRYVAGDWGNTGDWGPPVAAI